MVRQEWWEECERVCGAEMLLMGLVVHGDWFLHLGSTPQRLHHLLPDILQWRLFCALPSPKATYKIITQREA